LGQYEGFEPIPVEYCQQVIDLQPGCVTVVGVSEVLAQPLVESALADRASRRIYAYPPSNREHPTPNGSVTTELMQRPEGTLESLLRQVIRIGGRAEKPAEPPDVWLKISNQFVERPTIARLGPKS